MNKRTPITCVVEAHSRTYLRAKKKADLALADCFSPLWHPQDFIDYERFAEAQQAAFYNLAGAVASDAMSNDK